jgi:ParB-like chromosome segregation protein Spo0J
MADIWNGADQLRVLLIPIEGIAKYPNNPRRGDETKIQESLSRFGQQKPIVVAKETNFIVAGNHVYGAAKSLGWTHIAAVVTDLSDKDAKAYLLADNRMSDIGDYNDSALAMILEDLATTGQLDGTGYDSDDLDELLAKLEKQSEESSQLADQSPTAEIVFDDDQQQDLWFEFVKWLKGQYPEYETFAARLSRHIDETIRPA